MFFGSLSFHHAVVSKGQRGGCSARAICWGGEPARRRRCGGGPSPRWSDAPITTPTPHRLQPRRSTGKRTRGNQPCTLPTTILTVSQSVGLVDHCQCDFKTQYSTFCCGVTLFRLATICPPEMAWGYMALRGSCPCIKVQAKGTWPLPPLRRHPAQQTNPHNACKLHMLLPTQ